MVFWYGHLIIACFYPHPFLCLSDSPLPGISVLRASCEEEEQIMSFNVLWVVVTEKGIQEGEKLTHITYSCGPQEWVSGPGARLLARGELATQFN